MTEHQKFDCAICGSPLIYLEAAQEMTCHDCGQNLRADVSCAQGHYLCDRCHSHSANDLIEQHCLVSEDTDPIPLAMRLMEDRRIKMHGPEHHFLVPAVLLTSYYNLTQQPDLKARKLRQARERAEKVPGGFCGSHGNCGAAVGAGIFASLVTAATPLSEKEWQMSNRMTATALMRIAEHGGPRCCKRDSFLAIREAVQFANKQLDVRLPITGDIRCQFFQMNRECRLSECLFFS